VTSVSEFDLEVDLSR